MSESAAATAATALLDRIQAPEGAGREIPDAATREIIGLAPVDSVADLDDAIARAKAAQPAWEALGHEKRSELLLAAADAIDANAEALAYLLSREQGKPLNGPNARFELGACSGWLRTNATTVLEPQTLVDDETLYAELVYKAAGVVGAIGPWNWPLMITIWQIGPSLRMGNTVVVKPSEYTPLSVLAMISVMNEVLPADVLIAVSGDREVGARLASHPDIDKIMFTGSTATGRRIIESSAGNLARLTLELGGNDAGIVLPGTDPKAIAQDLFWGAFINTGQTCAAMKRLYVHDSVYDEVVDELAEIAANTPIGNGLDEDNVLGPLQNKAQFDIVSGLVDAARDGGARIVTGGEAAPSWASCSTAPRSWPTSTTTPPSCRRSSSDRRCRSSATPTSTRRSTSPTRSTSGWVLPSGPATSTPPVRSPRGCRRAQCGSTTTAGCTRWCRSAA